jgi:Arc/MetJ-type ribon-helix-helix transcriptional regulator
MEKASLSLSEDVLEDVDQRVEAGEYDSRSEAVRERLALCAELEERVDELETDLQHAEARVQELENQLQNERDREDDVDDLATFADAERRARRRRERLEEARRRAGLVERAKWSLFGEPADLEERVDDVHQERGAPDRGDDARE